MDIQTHSEEPSLTILKLFTYGMSALLNVAMCLTQVYGRSLSLGF